MTPSGALPGRLRLAQAWLALCVALAIAGPIVAWRGFGDHLSSDRSLVADALPGFSVVDVGRAWAVLVALIAAGLAMKLVVFVAAAATLARRGGDRPFPLVLAGGILAYGVGIGLPLADAARPGLWVLELNRIVAIATLALATLTLPDEAFVERRRVVLFAVWVATAALLLHPVGLTGWSGLSRFPVATALIHAGFVALGLLAMAARYVEQTAERRQQMEWFLWGLAASGVALVVKALLPGGLASELFARVVYPVLQCCTVAALVVGVLKVGLWSLGRVLPTLFRVGFFVSALVVLTLLGKVIVDALHLHGASAARGVLLSAGLSFVAVWYGRHAIAHGVAFVFFPSGGNRLRAVELGVLALEDATNEAEVLWAIEGVFALGWPGSTVRVFRLQGSRAMDVAEGVAPPEAPRPVRDLRLIRVAQGVPPTLWLTLSAFDELVGAVKVSPASAAAVSGDDLALLERLVSPLSMAVWRVSQAHHFVR